MNSETDHVINRIQKLLALGKSPNKAEAESAILKAHELLRNYNLRIEDISEESSKRIVDRHPFGKIQTRPKQWRMIIAQEISAFNYCKLLIEKSGNEVLFTIIGYEHNARTAICLIE
ncbi:MAG TPA: DUF2786 domain-containing protein, partial [Spirochaetota bacterium]|nr:DUF2786 domain-containing protein [Spirochaetota bacterium]